MTVGLNISRLIKVQVNLQPLAAQFRNFDTLLIVGASDVIDVTSRIRSYTELESVAGDFGTTAPEYLAAELFFSQRPQPTILKIARWAKAGSKGLNLGGILTALEKNLALWQSITAGSFKVKIDGGADQVLAALDFSAAANLNAVAQIIETALAGCDVTWTGERFVIESHTAGGGTAATGTVTLNGQPAANDTVTIHGTAITFVAGAAVGNQITIGASVSATVGNLLAFLDASQDAGLLTCSYTRLGNVITVTSDVIGTGGNAITLAKNGANIAVSGATLTGGIQASTVGYAVPTGAGTDISAMLGLTAASGAVLINGVAAEAPVDCLVDLDNRFAGQFYGIIFADTGLVDADHLAVAAYVEGAGVSHLYGVTVTNTAVLDSANTSDLATALKAAGYIRSFCQYSQNAYAVASFFGRAFTVDFAAQNSTITLMYKQEPGVVPEQLSETEAETLEAKRCNVFVAYNNDTAIIEDGVMSGPAFFDEIHGADWLQNQIQVDVYNLLYTSPTKIPQTDAGTHLIVTTIDAACGAAVNNGLLAPGIWNSQGFGLLKQGDNLSKGYYVFAPPVSSQAQADRAARKSVPIQVAAKLAGAIHTVDIQVLVDR